MGKMTDYETRRKHWHDSVAASRAARKPSSRNYKNGQSEMLSRHILPGSRILQLGCADGDVLAALRPSMAFGVEPSLALAKEARIKHPTFQVEEAPYECFEAAGDFDYILASDVLIDCYDVDEMLRCVAAAAQPETRVVITTYSQLWRPILWLLRCVGLANSRFGNTWFSPVDVRSALEQRGFQIITESREILLPIRVPFLTSFFNRVLARLPILQSLCLHYVVIARSMSGRAPKCPPSVTVLVPARNEAGNIPRILDEIPKMGSFTEVLFIEGNSTDDTWEVLRREVESRNDPLIRAIKQPGRGKGDAVRAGFAEARGDIVMILDADLTVPAECLPQFYDVVSRGVAELANGTRLVYGMDARAMRFLNLVANQFFAFAFSYVLGQPVRDTLCGTKVLRKRWYDRIARNRNYFGDFDPFGDFDLLFGASRLHCKITDVPIRYRERTYGETNIRRFRDGIQLFRMLWIAFWKLKCA